MGAVHALQASPFQAVGKTIGWLLRCGVLIVRYFILFALGGGLVTAYLPTIPSGPAGRSQNHPTGWRALAVVWICDCTEARLSFWWMGKNPSRG
jgi:hypothetical protein